MFNIATILLTVIANLIFLLLMAIVDFVSVEMPSVLLMAAVRNVQIVCAHFSRSFSSFQA